MDDQIVNKYFKKTAKFAPIFQGVPFIRAIILNGSLAQGKIKETSDIDLLMIVQKGRLYTARLFLIILGFLTGQKRSKDENKPHAGKFCFNYFMTENYLQIPIGRGEEMDKYCAMNYSKSLLISGDTKIFDKFIKANKELFAKYNCDVATSAKVSDNNSTIKRIFERMLGGKFGDWLELRFKSLQIKLIEKDPRTKAFPELIVCSDQEARFHPPKHS